MMLQEACGHASIFSWFWYDSILPSRQATSTRMRTFKALRSLLVSPLAQYLYLCIGNIVMQGPRGWSTESCMRWSGARYCPPPSRPRFYNQFRMEGLTECSSRKSLRLPPPSDMGIRSISSHPECFFVMAHLRLADGHPPLVTDGNRTRRGCPEDRLLHLTRRDVSGELCP